MNRKFFASAQCAALAVLAVSARSAPLPQSEAAAIAQRDQHLSHATFVWKRTVVEHHTGMPADQVAAVVTKTQQGLEADYRRRGITDPSLIQRYLKEAEQSITQSLGDGSVSYTGLWQFERDGDTTLASGTKQTLSNMQFTFRQFYAGDNALVVFDKNTSTKGVALPTTDPVAWKTTGNSIDYDCPVTGLDLLPEHFAMLIGANPLAMHGAEWSLSSETPTAWVLTAHYSEQGAPTTVEVTLSKAHDGVPSTIHINQGGVMEAFQVQSFRRYQNEWIADKVEYSRTVPHIATESQVWELQSVQPSRPIHIADVNRPIHDYRLLGGNLTANAVHRYEVQGNHDIVHYHWEGQLPTEDQLRQIQSREHPGEAAPDPGKTSSLPFVGGLMSLAGAVWMFKRRGSPA